MLLFSLSLHPLAVDVENLLSRLKFMLRFCGPFQTQLHLRRWNEVILFSACAIRIELLFIGIFLSKRKDKERNGRKVWPILQISCRRQLSLRKLSNHDDNKIENKKSSSFLCVYSPHISSIHSSSSTIGHKFFFNCENAFMWKLLAFNLKTT